jgi:hypothetical protein
MAENNEVKTGTCGVCGGRIVEKKGFAFDPVFGPPIIGPGSRDQHTEVSYGFYCEKCGLKYEFITSLALKSARLLSAPLSLK